MASVPATASNPNNPAVDSPVERDIGDESRSDLLFGFNKLSLLRQIGLMIGLAASVALGVAIVLWAQTPNYQPVIGNMGQYDPQDVTKILDQAGISYKVSPASGALLVKSDDVYKARMRLAAAGVTDNKTYTWDMLDKSQGLGTSQFMEMARYRRALEGELARTISSLNSVHSARVHLAIPKQSVFVNDNRKPTASVFVDVFAGQRLSDEQVSSIVNLVASSVPEMKGSDVTVVDQRGNLLTHNGEDSESKLADEQLSYTQRYEDNLNQQIASLLRPIVGSGHFRAEVTADLDFSSVQQAQELYNPDQKAIRSEQTLDEQKVGGSEGGVPGALSNQPPGNATAPEMAKNVQQENQQGGQNASSSQTQSSQQPMDVRKQATRNFEVDRTLNYRQQAPGQVRRLTVAVAVDDIKSVDPKTGQVSYKPWPKDELQRLTMLVRDAVGYSAARGDSVTVVNTPFAPEEPIEFKQPHFWEQPWFPDLIKQVLMVLVILALILFLLRPTLKNLASGGRSARDHMLGGDGSGLDDLDGLEGGSAIREALEKSDELLLPGATDGYDRQINALKGLIADDPARVAQVVRQWVNADE